MARWLIVTISMAAASATLAQPAPATARWSQWSPDYGRAEVETVHADGFEIHYIDKGEGTPVLAFMHAFGGFAWWQSFIEPAAREHRVVSPDAETFSVPRLVALIETLDLGPVHVVSHSLPAWFAIHLASARPDLVRSLVLLEPAYAPDVESAASLAAVYEPWCTLSDVPQPVLERCLLVNGMTGPGYFESVFEGIPDKMRALLVEPRGAAIDAALRESGIDPVDPVAVQSGWLLAFPPICEVQRRLDVPVLVVRGAVSARSNRIGLDAHEECLPPHETAVIEGATHFTHIDQPTGFNAAVLGFLDRLDR